MERGKSLTVNPGVRPRARKFSGCCRLGRAAADLGVPFRARATGFRTARLAAARGTAFFFGFGLDFDLDLDLVATVRSEWGILRDYTRVELSATTLHSAGSGQQKPPECVRAVRMSLGRSKSGSKISEPLAVLGLQLMQGAIAQLTNPLPGHAHHLADFFQGA